MAKSQKIWDYINKRTPAQNRDEQEVLEKAQSFLQWRQMPFYDRHIAWLQEQSNAPVAPSPNHMDMVVGATRSNTFREVLAYMTQLEKHARMALGDEDV